MVKATRMAATGNATIITITAIPTTESRAMEIMPSAFMLLFVLVVIVIVILVLILVVIDASDVSF